MPGYRTPEMTIVCRDKDLKVTVPGRTDPVIDECSICHKSLPFPHDLVIQHRVDGIQVYSICGEHKCWMKIGKHMAEGGR